MVKCPACGEPVEFEDRFCATCGAVLSGGLEHTGAITSIIQTAGNTGSGAMSPVGSGARSDLPSGSAMLIVLRGPGEGTEYPLAQRIDMVSVGRSQEAEVFLDDVTVSRHHAELRHGAEGWSIRDAGSLNGTYVNRRRVEDHHLSGGDEIQIGKFRFIFLVGVEPER
jgi:pSer/pThr/pTyr-binding forkhead associated (FHA) protein